MLILDTFTKVEHCPLTSIYSAQRKLAQHVHSSKWKSQDYNSLHSTRKEEKDTHERNRVASSGKIKIAKLENFGTWKEFGRRDKFLLVTEFEQVPVLIPKHIIRKQFVQHQYDIWWI